MGSRGAVGTGGAVARETGGNAARGTGGAVGRETGGNAARGTGGAVGSGGGEARGSGRDEGSGGGVATPSSDRNHRSDGCDGHHSCAADGVLTSEGSAGGRHCSNHTRHAGEGTHDGVGLQGSVGTSGVEKAVGALGAEGSGHAGRVSVDDHLTSSRHAAHHTGQVNDVGMQVVEKQVVGTNGRGMRVAGTGALEMVQHLVMVTASVTLVCHADCKTPPCAALVCGWRVRGSSAYPSVTSAASAGSSPASAGSSQASAGSSPASST